MANEPLGDNHAVENVVQLRVTYAEVDKMGVVYYGNYLRWFEIGRTEHIRAHGKSYKEWEAEGYVFPVVEAYARYRVSAFYDDVVEICTAHTFESAARVKFVYRVLRQADQTLLVEGHTVHACLGPSGRPRRFPLEVLQANSVNSSKSALPDFLG